MSDDHDARITANEDEIDDLRRDHDITTRRTDDLNHRVRDIESILRHLLSRTP